jgi:hypothetical protein
MADFYAVLRDIRDNIGFRGTALFCQRKVFFVRLELIDSTDAFMSESIGKALSSQLSVDCDLNASHRRKCF